MNPLMEMLGNVGYALDTPGAYLRGGLSGRLGERASGRDMLESWGALDPNEEGLDWGDAAGLAVDLVADPLNIFLAAGGAKYIPKLGSSLARLMSAFSEAPEAAALARAAGVAGEAAPEVAEALARTAATEAPEAGREAIRVARGMRNRKGAVDAGLPERVAAEAVVEPPRETVAAALQSILDEGPHANPWFSRTVKAVDHPKFPGRVQSWEQASKKLIDYGASPAELRGLDSRFRGAFDEILQSKGAVPKNELQKLLDDYIPRLETGRQTGSREKFSEFSTKGGVEGTYREIPLYTRQPELERLLDNRVKARQAVYELENEFDLLHGNLRHPLDRRIEPYSAEASDAALKALDDAKEIARAADNEYWAIAKTTGQGTGSNRVHIKGPNHTKPEAHVRLRDYLTSEGELNSHIIDKQTDIYVPKHGNPPIADEGLLSKDWEKTTIKAGIHDALRNRATSLTLPTGDESFINSASGTLKEIKGLDDSIRKLGLSPETASYKDLEKALNAKIADLTVKDPIKARSIEDRMLETVQRWKILKGMRDHYDVRGPRQLLDIGKEYGTFPKKYLLRDAGYGGNTIEDVAGDLTTPGWLAREVEVGGGPTQGSLLKKISAEHGEWPDEDTMRSLTETYKQYLQHLVDPGENPLRTGLPFNRQLMEKFLREGVSPAAIMAMLGGGAYAATQGQEGT